MVFLLLETGMMGVFLALDLLLFFVFWEVGLVPMRFLIAQWGGGAAVCRAQVHPLHHAGSWGLLLAIQLMCRRTFDLPALMQARRR